MTTVNVQVALAAHPYTCPSASAVEWLKGSAVSTRSPACSVVVAAGPASKPLTVVGGGDSTLIYPFTVPDSGQQTITVTVDNPQVPWSVAGVTPATASMTVAVPPVGYDPVVATWPSTGQPAFAAIYVPPASSGKPGSLQVTGLGPWSLVSSLDAAPPPFTYQAFLLFDNQSAAGTIINVTVGLPGTPTPTLADVWGTSNFQVRGPGDHHPFPVPIVGTELTVTVQGNPAFWWRFPVVVGFTQQPVVDPSTGVVTGYLTYCPNFSNCSIPTHAMTGRYDGTASATLSYVDATQSLPTCRRC
jgi:hypothetical protein